MADVLSFDIEFNGEVEIEAGTRRTKRTSPWIVPMSIFIDVIMFILQITVNGGFEPISKNPALGVSDETMVRLGGLNWEKIVHERQIWRFYTASWLHDGLTHLIPKVVFMVMVGIPMERQHGSWRVASILTLSGVGGNVLSSLFLSEGARGGAHSGLMGLLGSTRSGLITNWSLCGNKRVAVMKIVLSFMIDFIFMILPRSHLFTSIGGGSTGFSIGFTLLVRFSLPEHSTTKTEYKKCQRVYHKVFMVMMILGFIAGFVCHYAEWNVYEHCIWCRRFSCIHSLKWTDLQLKKSLR